MKNGIRYHVMFKNSKVDKDFRTVDTFETLEEAQELFDKLVEGAYKEYCVFKDEGWGFMIKHTDVCAKFVFPSGYEIIKIVAENLAECFVLINVYK